MRDGPQGFRVTPANGYPNEYFVRGHLPKKRYRKRRKFWGVNFMRAFKETSREVCVYWRKPVRVMSEILVEKVFYK
jgi:hypothetical protein